MPSIFQVESTLYVSLTDLRIGIPTLLLCIELLVMSILHIFAFPWQTYRIPAKSLENINSLNSTKQGGFLGIMAFVDALNIWDLVKALGRAGHWLFVGFWHRKSDSSYDLIQRTTGEANAVLEDARIREDLELMGSNKDRRLSLDDASPQTVNAVL